MNSSRGFSGIGIIVVALVIGILIGLETIGYYYFAATQQRQLAPSKSVTDFGSVSEKKTQGKTFKDTESPQFSVIKSKEKLKSSIELVSKSPTDIYYKIHDVSLLEKMTNTNSFAQLSDKLKKELPRELCSNVKFRAGFLTLLMTKNVKTITSHYSTDIPSQNVTIPVTLEMCHSFGL